jgi:hypothetical protein
VGGRRDEGGGRKEKGRGGRRKERGGWRSEEGGRRGRRQGKLVGREEGPRDSREFSGGARDPLRISVKRHRLSPPNREDGTCRKKRNCNFFLFA